MPQSNYDVNINITARDKASSELDKVSKATKSLGKQFLEAVNPAKAMEGVILGIGQSIGGFAAKAVAQIPKVAAELVNLGMQSESASMRFERFAGGTERASMFLDAFNSGAQGTVDKMSAMASGAKLLQMGLVGTGNEMEQIVAIATRLGDQSQDAGDRINDFSLLLANQSVMRLDNFGISSGRVRERIDELLSSGEALNREEAFKMAVMEEGSKSLEVLGDTTETASYKMGILKAALSDAKTGVGELALEAVEATGDVSAFAEGIRAIPEILRNTIGTFGKSRVEINAWAMQLQDSGEIAQYARFQIKEEADGISSLSYVSDQVKESLKGQTESQGMLMHRVLAAADAIRREGITSQNELEDTVINTIAALDEEVKSVDRVAHGMDKMAQLSISMQFTGFFDQAEAQQEEFAQRREEIEAEHQTRIAELQVRGQAKAVRIDAAAEQEKLVILRRRLEIARQQQSEFTDKTKQSTQMSKETQIATLQGQIAEQETLLDDYHAGRLVTTGENVNALIAEEIRRKNAAIATLDEQMAKQEEVQKKALGQMMLQAFDSWSSQKDIPDEMKDEWVKKTIEMRTAIAEEYGLVDKGSTALVTDMVSEWDTWADGTKVSTDEVVKYMGLVVDATGDVQEELLELTAHAWTIRVQYELMNVPEGESVPIPKGKPGVQQYNGLSPRVTGTTILPGSSLGTGISDNRTYATYNETINVYSPAAMAAHEETRRRRRAQIGRYM